MSPEKQVKRASYRKSRIRDFNFLLKKYFITGLLVITPLWGTYLILKALFLTLDGVLGGFLRTYFPYYVPGLGVIVLVLIILLAGVLTTNFLGRKVFDLWESFLQRVPVIRNVYSLVKSVVDTLSLQGKEKFNRVVLIEFPRKGQYSIAFVTGVTKGEVQDLTHEKVINIYVPTTPNPTSGYFLFVPESEIIPLSMSVEDGMKMVISGGLYTPSESEGAKNSRKG